LLFADPASIMASVTPDTSVLGKSTLASEEKGMPGLKLLSGVADTVIEAADISLVKIEIGVLRSVAWLFILQSWGRRWENSIRWADKLDVALRFLLVSYSVRLS
jgi:hypothetical protein